MNKKPRKDTCERHSYLDEWELATAQVLGQVHTYRVSKHQGGFWDYTWVRRKENENLSNQTEVGKVSKACCSFPFRYFLELEFWVLVQKDEKVMSIYC